MSVRLLLVRHAIAEARETFAAPDSLRPLTDEGRKKMRRAARALREQVPELRLVATSPLLRAVQTAEIVAQAYGGAELVETPCLEPGADVRELAKWLTSQAQLEAVAVVGHEPDLSSAASWLAGGLSVPCVRLGKGGACLLDLPGAIDAGRATLVWLLRPSQLRALA